MPEIQNSTAKKPLVRKTAISSASALKASAKVSPKSISKVTPTKASAKATLKVSSQEVLPVVAPELTPFVEPAVVSVINEPVVKADAALPVESSVMSAVPVVSAPVIESNAVIPATVPAVSAVRTPAVNRPFIPLSKQVSSGKSYNAPYIKSVPIPAPRPQAPKPQNFERDKIAKAMTLKELDEKLIMDLRKIADSLNINDSAAYAKNDLIIRILEEQTRRGGNIFAEGVLEIINDGSHGVLRNLKMLPGNNDVYVSGSQIKRFNLRQGDFISGQARAPKEGERYLSMLRIEAINNTSPEAALSRPFFQKLTPIFPNEQIKLETEPHILSTRLIDLLAPIGKGQRGMLVSPPKVGKTWLLKEIAEGITTNHPDIHLIVVLVGERPEEVTDMERSVKGEVVASNFDEPPEQHTKVAEMAIERAKRLVELGKDVVILMDSLTRLARAYNITAPPSGRTLSGGFDPVAIYPPKKFFGAARNFEVGGSLTIIATALVETGSRMDEVIFEEFKGTGNMELKLDRKLAEKRIYPAIDVKASSTRNEDKLLPPEILNQSWRVRRMLDIFNESDATAMLVDRLKKTKSNKEFLATLHEDR